MTWRLYCRVSTEDQDALGQVRILTAYATARGVSFRTYVDNGESGAKPPLERPQMAALLADFQKGDVLASTRVDRLGRTLRDLVSLLDGIHARGGDVVCTEQPIDTTSPLGVAMWQILGVFAELERAMTMERSREVLLQVAASGVHMGRHRKGCTVRGSPCDCARRVNERWKQKRKLLPRSPLLDPASGGVGA